MSTRQESLEELKDTALNCHGCSLRKGCRGVVFGEGNPDASLMLIGEGPGGDEDILGRPFVGKAGQLLDKILQAAGFERFTHTFIANVVKCRPPENRTPTPEEREACLPLLRVQFKILRPQIVVLLGATALQAIIEPKASITASRGQWIEKGGVWFMPTYHPAALLRNPNLKNQTWEDFKLVIDKYRNLVDKNHYCRNHPVK